MFCEEGRASGLRGGRDPAGRYIFWGVGGRGSGRHNGARKHRVESCLTLDVNVLHRKGALTPGASGTLLWGREGADAEASVTFRVDEATLILCYDDGHAAGFCVEQHVSLTSVPVAFGGSRAYFLCPGADCGRRSLILYFHRGVFRCRHCHGLAYESQREDAKQRARRRADKLRARFCWPKHRIFAPQIVVRPKGMWSRTFDRLRGDAVAAEAIATAAQVAHWTRLLRKLERRQRQARQG